jgi:histidinol-phosphate aminotransferase
MSVEDRVNAHIRRLAPYQPGKPMEELERELGIPNSVKLASNENPLGPSPKAVQAIRDACAEIHRYPDGASFALRAALASKLDVAESQLVFGCGADEVLELLAKTFLAPGDEVVHPWPSFAMYPIVIKGMGATPVAVPLSDDMGHDLEAMAAAITERTKIVFVCNPNNPTGTSIGADEFDAFVERLPESVVLAVDEAYREFVRRPDFPDAIAWTKRRPGTVVLRTFSKIYGLAGMRVGYGVGDPELIGFLERARHPFNVNRMAEVAALAALDDEEHAERTHAMNAEGIELLTRELRAMGHEVWPTDANFLLTRTGPGTYDALLRLGVIVRPLGGFGMDEHIRISIGTPEENQRLVKALQRIAESAETAEEGQ